jgi:hypothetical protein
MKKYVWVEKKETKGGRGRDYIEIGSRILADVGFRAWGFSMHGWIHWPRPARPKSARVYIGS